MQSLSERRPNRHVAMQVQGAAHPKATLSGALGIFAGLLTLGWALFGYNLPATLGISAVNPQNLMLVQVAFGFLAVVAGGLMMAHYPGTGGALNVLGSLTTFTIGIFYSRGLELAARGHHVDSLELQFSRYYSASLNLPLNVLVSSLLIFAVFPVAFLLLISGLGGLATHARAR